jgi:hypothetical protein
MGFGGEEDDMRLKVGLVAIIGLLLAVSNAMAASIVLSDISPGPNDVTVIAPKSTLFGIWLGSTAVSKPGNGGNASITEGEYIVKLKDKNGLLHDPISLDFANVDKLGKQVKIYYGIDANQFVLLDSKAGSDRLAAVPTPEPGTFFLLAGTMAVGLGFLRKRAQK